MLHLVSNILLIDTLGFLAVALVISYLPKRGEHTFLLFMHQKRFLILALFPWLALLVWLEKPGKQLRRRIWWYRACYLLFLLGVIALMLIGVARRNDGIIHLDLAVFVWILLLDGLIRGREDHGGKGDHHHDNPPHGPTPTGNAAEHWLQSQQTPTDHS